MDGVNFDRVEAIHPHWTGFLKLSTSDNAAEREGNASKATYDLSDRTLTVFWEKWKPDVFLRVSGVYVHQDLLTDLPRLEQTSAVTIRNRPFIARRVSVVIPDRDYEVLLRLKTSDVPTFEQVFVAREYESPNLPEAANVIVDLGANIGLAAVFFGLKYPTAQILCVEPEASNFAVMLDNTAALGDRVRKQHAAVWTKDGFINLHTENEEGAPLGAWGVQVSDRKTASSGTTRCYKIGTLLDQAGFDSADILKVDVEGAELEIFSQGAAEWLPRVKLIVVETHDRFRPGSDDAVRKAVQPMFEELPRSGENLFFRRKP